MKTPQRSIHLPPGKHSVVLVNETFGLEDRFSVEISSNETTTVIRDFSDRL